MKENTILIRSGEYVKCYRDSLDNNTSITRDRIENSILVIFLGEALENCKITCENTMNNLFWNCSSMLKCYSVCENSADEDIESKIKNMCSNSFQDSSLRQSLQVNIVTKINSELSDKIFDIISNVFKEFSVSFENISFYIYSIFKSNGNRKSIENLNTHLSTIEDRVFKNINNHAAYSILVGNSLTREDSSSYQDAIASSIVLTNKKITLGDFGISDKAHSIIGFSQADISLETIYIIGFDIFTDTIIDYFRKGYKQIGSGNFDINQNILRDYINKIEGVKQQLKGNSKNLWHKNSLSNGEYSFAEIDSDYGNTLHTYFTVNLARKNIKCPSDDEITDAFNEYLFNYFKEYGLDKARNHLEFITNQEKKNQQAIADVSSLTNQSFSYDKGKPNLVIDEIIDSIAIEHINELMRKTRNIIISIGENNDNILENIEKIFKNLESCTEKCKQESVFRDKSFNNNIKSVYEDIINASKDDIKNQMKDMKFDYSLFALEDDFANFIFDEYEGKIVTKYLFVNLKNYADDTALFEMEKIGSWIKRQCDNADFSMEIAGNKTEPKPLFLTDIVNSNEHSNLATYLKNSKCNYISVSGLPIFRTLHFRTVEKQDLTLIQRLNSSHKL